MSGEPPSPGAAIAEHVQAALRELIAAARAALELADELVSDPARLAELVRGPRADAVDRPAGQVERIVVEDGRGPGGSAGES